MTTWAISEERKRKHLVKLRAFEELNENEKCQKRRNLWYRRWHLLAREIKKHRSNPKRILEQMYRLVEEIGGHGYAWIAYTSEQDMRLVIEDCLEQDCEECKHRFRCFTER